MKKILDFLWTADPVQLLVLGSIFIVAVAFSVRLVIDIITDK